MTFRTLLLWLFLGMIPFGVCGQGGIYQISSGSIAFRSDAPLELIEAKSTGLRGLIEPESGKFAFSVPIRSFEGFNGPVQKEHFNENYLESHQYPSATFSGKIIEKIDFSIDGTYSVRAKGKLTIHGVEQERIIKSQLVIKNGRMGVDSDFSVWINEHKINIPKIVHQKIAEEIYVSVKANFEMVQPK